MVSRLLAHDSGVAPTLREEVVLDPSHPEFWIMFWGSDINAIFYRGLNKVSRK
jgi:hypothetical protein